MTRTEKVILFILQVTTPGMVVLSLATGQGSEDGTTVSLHELLDAFVASLAVSAATFRLLFVPIPPPAGESPGQR